MKIQEELNYLSNTEKRKKRLEMTKQIQKQNDELVVANQENEKVEGLVNQIENLKLDLENINKSIDEYKSGRNDAVNQVNQLQQDISNLNNKFVREESMKNNAIGEYDILRKRFSALELENSELKNTITESKELTIKYSALELENSELKNAITESKVKKQKVAV